MKITDGRAVTINSSIDFVEETIGIVVKNRDETEMSRVGVFIPRFMNAISITDEQNGEWKEEPFEVGDAGIVNEINKSIGSTTVTEQNYITCSSWLPNGITMAYLVKGERVLCKFADKDIKSLTIYPMFNHNDVKKRLTDDQRYYIVSKLSDEDEADDDHTYFLRFNSRDKFIHLHTSIEQEENNGFDLKIDTEKGTIKITDYPDSKRLFEWNYNEDKFYHETDGGTKVLVQDNHVQYITEDFEILASNSIHFKTSNYKLEADIGENIVTDESHENTSFFHDTTNYVENTTLHKMTGTSYFLTFTSSAFEGATFQYKVPTVVFDTPTFFLNGIILFMGFKFNAPVPCPIPPPPPDPPKQPANIGAIDDSGGSSGSSGSSSSKSSSKGGAEGNPGSQGMGPAVPQGFEPFSFYDGGGGLIDLKNNNEGKTSSFSEPVMTCLAILAAFIDLNANLLSGHIHGPAGSPGATAGIAPVLPLIPTPRYKS